MTNDLARLSHAGPATYEVVQAVKPGLLIEARPAGKVGLAAAGSTKCLGVGNLDAKPWVDPVSTDGDGFETINVSPLPTHTTVGFGRYVVEYAADAAFGDALICAAGGKVTPAGAAPDARTIVGYCDEPNGVVVATKAKGLANISR